MRRTPTGGTTVVRAGTDGAAPFAVSAVPDAPIVVGVLGTEPADAALQTAFAEAQRRGLAVLVLGVGAADAEADVLLADRIDRWAEKYPDVAVTAAVRRGIDAAVTLTAVSRCAAALVLEMSRAPVAAAVATAVRRRASCPVVLVTRELAVA
jgi:hypothetical protein